MHEDVVKSHSFFGASSPDHKPIARQHDNSRPKLRIGRYFWIQVRIYRQFAHQLAKPALHLQKAAENIEELLSSPGAVPLIRASTGSSGTTLISM